MRAILVTALLVSTVGHAQSLEAPSDVPKPESVRSTRFAVWTAGVRDWFFNVMVGPMSGQTHLTVPVGMNVQSSETTDWVFELRPMYWRSRCDEFFSTGSDPCGSLLALRGTVGLEWTHAPGARGNGFFIQPKLSGMVMRDTAKVSATEGERQETGGQLTAGFDLGYRHRAANGWGYIAPVVGLAVGYGWNQRRSQFGTGMLFSYTDEAVWRNQVIQELNLDILRIGGAF